MIRSQKYLEFEQPIADLQAKIEELRLVGSDNALNITEEISRLQEKSRTLTESIFANLSSWQVTQMSRHPQRPYTLDYIEHIFTDFEELHGDRHFADDAAIVGGIARLDGRPVMVIGHQKGRDVKEKVRRNFGMPKPEGYRKACRLMQMAERFKMPIITFIDTPGAYPGIDAEERGQSEAIAWNLQVMSRLKTPIISTVIGEGGSGGALAIGVCDRLMMLQYSIYSVISPEGCASILWKSAEKATDAAEAMGVTAGRLKELGLVDNLIEEPLGGAHRDPAEVAARIKAQLLLELEQLARLSVDELPDSRFEPLMAFGLQYMSDLPRALEHLAPCLAAPALCLGLSGGLDSMVLLHAVTELRRHSPLPPLKAIHVHHGIHPDADRWVEHCQRECAARQVDLVVHRVTLPSGGNVEELARDARYGVFEQQLGAGDWLLLAHHADDQLETLLFRLMRGTGVRGLAGMPRSRALGQGRLLRPLLDWTRAQLADWAAAQGLAWIEDPANA